MGELIDFKTEDGSTKGYLTLPTNGSGPGILLMHAWWGLNDFFTELADRLAAEGYLVLAPDLYEGKIASTIDGAEELSGALDYRQAIKHEEAALDYLLKHPAFVGDRVAAIGFSMGVAYATWLATLRPDELRAVVMFYGGSDQADVLSSPTNASFQGHFAEGDEWEPDEYVRKLERQLKDGGKDVAFYYYQGVGHWFMENNRPDNYDPEAAELAWQRTVGFLREKLGT